MMLRLVSILLLSGFLVAGCSSRPPWAEGRMIRERAPAAAVASERTDLPRVMLAVHNRERASIGAPPVAWDAGLAADAALYGPALARLGKLAHSEPTSRAGEGENLWMGSAGAYRFAEMAESWAAEKQLFRPGVFPQVSRNGHWSDVAHYTQMIWPASRRIGCALYSDAHWDYLICRYAPAGNVVGGRLP
jgi:hypothetical protein